MIFKRTYYLKKIEQEFESNKILFLIGARQVGKTSLLLSLEKYLGIKNFSYLSFDSYNDLNFNGIDDFLDFIYKKTNNNNPDFILLDEVQSIKDIGILLKGIYDKFKRENKSTKLICSGSGSIEIFRGITDSLIGRKKIINIYPFSFLEFLEYKKFNTSNINIKNVADWEFKELIRLFEEFIIYGGYPEVVITNGYEQKLEILKGIYSDYIYKDISFYLKENEIIYFDKFLKFVGYGVCSAVKIENIVNEIGVSRRLIKKFIFLVENTFILNFVPSFTKNKQKEISKHKKVYFTDLGFLRIVMGITSLEGENKGKFIENFVFLELLKYKKNLENIYFWKKINGSEIDFILEDDFSGKISPIEVKTGSKDNIPIIFKSFIKDYKKIIDKFYIINKDIIKSRNLEEKEVFVLSYLLLFKEFNSNSQK